MASVPTTCGRASTLRAIAASWRSGDRQNQIEASAHPARRSRERTNRLFRLLQHCATASESCSKSTLKIRSSDRRPLMSYLREQPVGCLVEPLFRTAGVI